MLCDLFKLLSGEGKNIDHHNGTCQSVGYTRQKVNSELFHEVDVFGNRKNGRNYDGWISRLEHIQSRRPC